MEVKILNIFIASPSDTEQERALCDEVVSEINSQARELLKVRLETKKWELDARPSFGNNPQDVINTQLLKDIDIFVGILRNRFGTPTEKALSGTEEEFDIAYQKYKDSSLDIMMYFSSTHVDPYSIDTSQFEKVKSFKEKISALGGLYGTYQSLDEFREKLKKNLWDLLVGKFGANSERTDLVYQAEEINRRSAKDAISCQLKNRLIEALCSFSYKPNVWIEPILSKSNNISRNADRNYESRVKVDEIVASPSSIIVKAPPQFGLTCLAHYLVSSAWEKDKIWVYLDSRKCINRPAKKSIERELSALGIGGYDFECIVLDEWNSGAPGAKKLLKSLCHEYKDIPIVVMEKIDDCKFKNAPDSETINRDFSVVHMLSLPRSEVRKVVVHYNQDKNIADENKLLDKVINDLNALNIHRTPLNCITLLKVSENYYDESPANRTKMIEMVLFVLFNIDDFDSYSTKPDMKDCEYVLGRFCETMIRKNGFEFSQEEFVTAATEYCNEKLLSLEVKLVFDILFKNNIIVFSEGRYTFRSSYWIYYFAATRMYADTNFRDYIIQDQGLVSFPEIIEFYTGIDRARGDVLELLCDDLETACLLVEKKTGFQKDFNPLNNALWTPTEDSISEMRRIVDEDVSKSKLPEEIKDRHADKKYNQLRPYDQSVQVIMEDYSLTALMRKVKAASRALRNSDYVDPDLKRRMLGIILSGWKQISRILFALAPLLAEKGSASFEGQNFTLDGDFGDNFEDRVTRIFLVNPINVVSMFRYDLFSSKIGPLLYDRIYSEKDSILKHSLILLLVFERPSGWRKQVEMYIESIRKNSYYLADLVNALSEAFKFDFLGEVEMNEIRHLIKMGYAKHEFGSKKPSMAEMRRVSYQPRENKERNSDIQDRH